jgi:hypothetical protein
MIKVTQLLEDGFELMFGDTVYSVIDGLTVTITSLAWLGEEGVNNAKEGRNYPADFRGWYLKECVPRTEDQLMNYPREVSFSSLDTGCARFEVDLEALEEHYSNISYQNGTIIPETDFNPAQELTEAVMYTEEQYEAGILPQKGMTVFTGDLEQNKWVVDKIGFRHIQGIHNPQVLVHGYSKQGGGFSSCLTNLKFPDEVDPLRESISQEVLKVLDSTRSETPTSTTRNIITNRIMDLIGEYNAQ